ncbi:MAG: phosphopantetheine-binding protein [Bacteroidales bacterium]|nr:phosphopantetheine-binding protein [Bacteroidales bacterium]
MKKKFFSKIYILLQKNTDKINDDMEDFNRDKLNLEIKQLILDTLKIPDIKPEEINDSVPLFSPENVLQLDSIDSLEIVIALQQKYEVRIDDQNLARSVLQSINSIADFIVNEKNK